MSLSWPRDRETTSRQFCSTGIPALPFWFDRRFPREATRWRCSDALKEAGIQTSLHYPFILAFFAFGDRTASQDAPARDTSRRFCTCVMTLPLYPTMTDEQVGAVCEALLRASGG